MVRPDRVETILSNLKGYVEKLWQLAAFPPEVFLTDFTKVESAKHLFQVSVECCLDGWNLSAFQRRCMKMIHGSPSSTKSEKKVKSLIYPEGDRPDRPDGSAMMVNAIEVY